MNMLHQNFTHEISGELPAQSGFLKATYVSWDERNSGAGGLCVARCHTRLSEENQVQTYMHARISFMHIVT
jgi:hypothetical protein